MGKTLIDIGTNRLGGYLKLKKMLGITDSWQKIFLEPNPENHDFLKDAVSRIPNAIFIPAAVTSDGVPLELITRSDVSGDIAATTRGKDFLDDVLSRFDMKAPGYNRYQVKAITLEQVLSMSRGDQVYIKMDCEGSEYELLETFPPKYLSVIKALFVEFHGQQYLKQEALRLIFKRHGIIIQDWE